ncbi:cyclophilin-like fold protein [Nocardia sp. NBC_01730]|uniref:cyclophilin-like fold protein n=1 Tax=Nocardia sp. NBC_01730 TaxID=2975998 RepID=UPI002E102E7F|nr:cyclophilin-like fold protein [Nocardia sp. NBC_01730]
MRSTMIRLAVFAATVTAAAALTACGNTSDSASTTAAVSPATSQPGQEESFMWIRLSIGEAEATARLYDNATARDFASLLPVTIATHDLGGREKAGPLPRALAGGEGQSGYRAGQLGYWPPNNDLAIYYHADGFRIPSPGIVMIGEIETGLDAVTADDNATITAG